MAIERTYNVPLRREWLKVPLYKRAKKAGVALKEFMAKHMKSDNVLVGPKLNMKIWENGIRNPPHHVKVTAIKDDKGFCRVELFGHKFVEKKRIEKKTPKAGGMAGKLQEKMAALKKDPKDSKEKDSKEKDSKEKDSKEKKDDKKADEKPSEKVAEKPAEKTAEKKPKAKPAE